MVKPCVYFFAVRVPAAEQEFSFTGDKRQHSAFSDL